MQYQNTTIRCHWILAANKDVEITFASGVIMNVVCSFLQKGCKCTSRDRPPKQEKCYVLGNIGLEKKDGTQS